MDPCDHQYITWIYTDEGIKPMSDRHYRDYGREPYPPEIVSSEHVYSDGARHAEQREVTPPPPPPASFEEGKMLPGHLLHDVPVPEGVDMRTRKRVSRAERDKYVAHIRMCYEDDRMDEREFTRRMELASAAVTEADLQILMHDLPGFPGPEPEADPTVTEQVRKALGRLAADPLAFLKELWVRIVFIALSFMGSVVLAVIPAVALMSNHHSRMAEAVATLCIIAGAIWFIVTFVWMAITIENHHVR